MMRLSGGYIVRANQNKKKHQRERETGQRKEIQCVTLIWECKHEEM